MSESDDLIRISTFRDAVERLEKKNKKNSAKTSFKAKYEAAVAAATKMPDYIQLELDFLDEMFEKRIEDPRS